MKNYILLLLFITTPILAYNSSNGLIYIPKAKMAEVGYTEYGLVNNIYQHENEEKSKYQGQGYFRYAVSDRFEYGLGVLDSQHAVHHLHGNIFSHEDEGIGLGHDLAIGVKNVGWEPPSILVNEPVYDAFIAYSLSILNSGASYHFGVARDKLDDEIILYMAGAEYAFPFGVISLEWDGRAGHIGYKYYSGDRGLFYVAISPSAPVLTNNTQVMSTRFVSIGLSFQDNIIKRFRKKMVSRRDLEDEIDKVNLRISLIESKEKALAEVTSAAFLDELEKQYLDNKFFDKEVRVGSKSLLKGALSHMQRGLEYYYQGDFEAALEEYKIVVSLMPDFSMGHARLGSIYHQTGNVVRARDHWEKALALNPRNEALRALLKKQLNRPDNSISGELIEPMQKEKAENAAKVEVHSFLKAETLEEEIEE